MARSTIKISIDHRTVAAAADFVRLILEASKSNRTPELPSTANYDPYQLLGISKNATAEQVRKRYHQLSQVFHPDKQGGNLDAMKRLNEAHDSICKERGT